MGKKARKAFRAGALLLACAISARASAESLADAVSAAYSSNPTLRAARALQKQVDETYVQARSQYGLNLQASASETYSQVRGQYFKGQLSGTSPTATLQLTQPLYTGGRIHAAVNLAEANILSQRETLRQTETQILQQVVAAYVAVRRDLLTVRVYDDNVEALNRQLVQVQAQHAVNAVTQTDVDQARGRLALTRANAANARAQLEISRSNYLQVVGEAPGELEPEPVLDVFPTIDEAFETGEVRSPLLNAARYNEQVSRARVAQARAEFLPNVSAQVAVSRSPVQAYNSPLGDQTAVVAGIQASQSLFSSGLLASRVRQSKAEVEEAGARIELTRRSVVQSISQAFAQLVAARESLTADETATQATQAAFYGVRKEQPFDLRQSIDVLNAEQEFNNAQVRLLQDRYTEYVSRVNLLAAAGVLGAETLSPATTAYRPETHFDAVKGRGVPFYVGLLQTVNSIGAPATPPPAVAHAPKESQAHREPLPPSPTPAADQPPLRTATSVMDEERNDALSQPVRTGPSSHCWEIGGRKIGDCLSPAVSAPASAKDR